MTRVARITAVAIALCAPAVAGAEVTLSFYGGAQSAPHSRVTISGDDAIADTSFLAEWEGRSFEMPPYYGLRATYVWSDTLSFGLDMNHAKVYASDATLAESGLERLEFSDGINIFTLNAYRRWEDAYRGLTPYVGGGLGVSIPHVEVTSGDGSSETFEYQMTGPALALIAGARYPINDKWSVFGEYKGTYSQNEADLTGGGTLETDVVTNAVNLGVSFSF